MKRIIIYNVALLLAVLFVFASCKKDETTQTYSTQHRVFLYLNVMSYPELFNTVGNPGQYVSIRSAQRQREDAQGKPLGVETGMEIKSPLGTQFYALSKADATSFYFGLAGIIIGTTYDLENVAYDLGCPNCNYNSDKMRLRFNTDGTAVCPNCHIVYDLNNYGVISNTENNHVHSSPRGLYRYRVTYDGTSISVFN